MSEAQAAAPAAPAEAQAPATPAPETPAEAPKEERQASKWAEVTEREKAARARSERLKAEQKAIADAKAAIEAEKAQIEAIKKAASTGDFSKLEELIGSDAYEKWTRAKLRSGKPDPVATLKADLMAELEAKTKAEREKAESERKAADEEQRTKYYAQLDATLAETVKTGGEAFELLALEMRRNPERIRAALRYADSHVSDPAFLKSMGVSSPAELTVAKVAASLESELAVEAESWLSTSKFKSRLAPSAPAGTPQQTETPKAPKTEAGKEQRASGGPTTLTSRLSQETSHAPPVVDPDAMSDEELMKLPITTRLREMKRREDAALARAIAEAEAARDRRKA